jgi:hypothetical protein
MIGACKPRYEISESTKGEPPYYVTLELDGVYVNLAEHGLSGAALDLLKGMKREPERGRDLIGVNPTLVLWHGRLANDEHRDPQTGGAGPSYIKQPWGAG